MTTNSTPFILEDQHFFLVSNGKVGSFIIFFMRYIPHFLKALRKTIINAIEAKTAIIVDWTMIYTLAPKDNCLQGVAEYQIGFMPRSQA